MKAIYFSLVFVVVLILTSQVEAQKFAYQTPGVQPGISAALLKSASVEGKYEELIGTITIKNDAKKHKFKDDGYWEGGTYANIRNLPGGYWVYVAPTWYVWKRTTDVPEKKMDPVLLKKASANGKYRNLISTYQAPNDAKEFGSNKIHGYWKGGVFTNGLNIPEGFLVYVEPAWYLWKEISHLYVSKSSLADDQTRWKPGTYSTTDTRLFTGPDSLLFKYLLANKIYLYIDQVKADPAQGFMVPYIRTPDGGYLLVGYKDEHTEEDKKKMQKEKIYIAGKTFPVVAKTGKKGVGEWQKEYKKEGFLDYEGGWAIETPQHDYIVMIWCYVHPSRLPVSRFLKLNPSGNIIWELQLPGDGTVNSPLVNTAQLTASGSLVLKGHIYMDGVDSANSTVRDTYEWWGEISPVGKLVLNQTGSRINR